MYFPILQTSLFLVSAAIPALTQSAPPPLGYPPNIPSTVTNASFSFGSHYAVLNLDLVNGIVGMINTTTAGKAFINNTATWIDAVHKQTPPPISIFTRIYFQNSHNPEVGANWGFEKLAGPIGNLTASSPFGELYSAFQPLPDYDVVLQKVGYYAGAGNALEQILSAQKIDTVILSGLRTSGAILATVYRLWDLGYSVYVISNNTIETPSTSKAPLGDATSIDTALLDGVIPGLPANVITIEQAMAALGRSGPAVY